LLLAYQNVIIHAYQNSTFLFEVSICSLFLAASANRFCYSHPWRLTGLNSHRISESANIICVRWWYMQWFSMGMSFFFLHHVLICSFILQIADFVDGNVDLGIRRYVCLFHLHYVIFSFEFLFFSSLFLCLHRSIFFCI